jgi:MFS family permease
MRPEHRSSIVGLACVYVSFGLFWGVFGVAFADFIEARDLSYGAAGNLFAGLSVVSILMMVTVAQRLEDLPRGRVVAWAIGSNGVGVALLVLLPDPLLVLAFLVAGAGTGLVDVFVNAAGQEYESATVEPILQRLHALYSFGTAGGALATGFVLGAGIRFEVPVLASSAAMLAAAVVVWWWLTDLREADSGREERRGVSLSVFVTVPFLLVPALVLAAAFFVEGSMDVWAVVYLRESLDASPAVGSWGLAAFATALGLGRLFAARVLFRLGARATLLASGSGSLAAGGTAVAAGDPMLASIALLVLGFTVAAAAPAAIGMVGGAGVNTGVAIAAISTVGYIGFVVGPPVLGWLADVRGVHVTMAVIVAGCLGIVAGAALAPRRDGTSVLSRIRR